MSNLQTFTYVIVGSGFSIPAQTFGSGALGVLNNNPQAPLHVSGNAFISNGNLAVNNIAPTFPADVSGFLKARNYVMDLSGILTPSPTGALSGSLNLNFSGSALQTVTITGGTIVSGINYAPGAALTVRMFASGTTRAVAWAPWRFIGNAAPTGFASGKLTVLSLQCFDSTDTGVVAAYSTEP